MAFKLLDVAEGVVGRIGLGSVGALFRIRGLVRPGRGSRTTPEVEAPLPGLPGLGEGLGGGRRGQGRAGLGFPHRQSRFPRPAVRFPTRLNARVVLSSEPLRQRCAATMPPRPT